jgi:hypothetical protein
MFLQGTISLTATKGETEGGDAMKVTREASDVSAPVQTVRWPATDNQGSGKLRMGRNKRKEKG